MDSVIAPTLPPAHPYRLGSEPLSVVGTDVSSYTLSGHQPHRVAVPGKAPITAGALLSMIGSKRGRNVFRSLERRRLALGFVENPGVHRLWLMHGNFAPLFSALRLFAME